MFIRNAFLVLAAIVVMSVACQPSAQRISPLTEEDVAAIKSLGPAMDQTTVAGDWDALLALMTEDVIWMLSNSPAIYGRTACKLWLESAGLTITEHKLEFLEIDGYGDIAYARGVCAETVTAEGLAEPIEDTGKFLMIARRQTDGSWRIAILVPTSDLPLPEPDPEAET